MQRDRVLEFCGPEQFLLPAQRLTSLTLNIDQAYGYIPCLNITGIYFPHLITLSLRHMLFCHPDQALHDMEDFSVRHKARLETLVLDACAMYLDEWTSRPPHTWSDVWNRFEFELDNLMDLVVRWNIDTDISDEIGNMVLDICRICSQGIPLDRRTGGKSALLYFSPRGRGR